MTALASRARQRLESAITSDLHSLRAIASSDAGRSLRRALEALVRSGDADGAYFVRPAVATRGVVFTRAEHVGSAPVAAELERACASSRLEPLRESFAPSLADTKGFAAVPPLAGRLEEAELGAHVQLVASEGKTVAGCFGLYRVRGRAAFCAADGARLRLLVEPLGALAGALARCQLPSPAATGELVLGPDGAVELASAGGREWLALEGFGAALADRVRALHRAGRSAHLEVVDPWGEAVLVRLEGAAGTRYVASVSALTPCTLSSDVLTTAEREVAELAAAGATAQEIAAIRGTSAGTVKNQLKRVYKTLGVACRVELARALARRAD